jgi:phosphoribosylformylglycinamidine cyclo-ligase
MTNGRFDRVMGVHLQRAEMSGISYEKSGVDYDRLDAFKRACQKAAATTTSMLRGHGLSEPPAIRGESAYLIETPEEYLAHVEEGLGTKNLVADAMLERTGKSFYRNIGIDTVATIVNDLVTTGALPISVAMHAAVGDAQWLARADRAEPLADGFAQGCILSRSVWGGGETPTLRGIVDPETIVLAGSAIGRIRPKGLRIVGDVREGDAIVLLASSGVHTNGLTLCRTLAERLPQGYLTPIDDGRNYGEALLDASVIYVRYVAALQAAGVRPHYAAHITGHGWRKLMRLHEPFVYRMTRVPEPPAVFRFIVRAGPIELREAYATFNMGAGFAVYVDPADVERCLNVARESGYEAWVGGTVLKQGSRKAVEIPPLGITFEGETLRVR